MANGIDHQVIPSESTEMDPQKIIETPSTMTSTEPSKTEPVSTPINGTPTAINNETITPASPQTAKVKSQKSRTASPAPSIPSGHTNMTRDQLKYSAAIMRNLKKHRDAAPFLNPVDYVKLNVPDYPKIIKYPMDLNTVDRKLNNCEYENVEDFIADVRLVFSNCYKFNGPEAMISMLCQNVESAFEKSLRQMPLSKEPPSPGPSTSDTKDRSGRKKGKGGTPPAAYRRISEDGRPKREIHPPPSKDYPEPMTKRRNPRKNDAQLKFCAQVLRELRKNKYRNINYPFLAPVDIVALNIPDYPSIIKHPMDMSTIERKLNEGDYENADEFEADIRLMFNNCYTYNPPVTPVYKMGKELESIFDEKWKQKPEPQPVQPEKRRMDDYEDEVESDDDYTADRIAELERSLATLTQKLQSIKSGKRKRAERGSSKAGRSRPSGSRDKKPAADKRRRTSKSREDELPEFTFEQKKDLSERINNLTGDRLNTVVTIIQNSMPNLDGQGQEEIVLDIDSLDRRTLHQLHEFVTGKSLIPQRKQSGAKGGRKHYSEQAADRKMQALEGALQKFNGADNSSSESESESSSGSDSDDSGSSSD